MLVEVYLFFISVYYYAPEGEHIGFTFSVRPGTILSSRLLEKFLTQAAQAYTKDASP